MFSSLQIRGFLEVAHLHGYQQQQVTIEMFLFKRFPKHEDGFCLLKSVTFLLLNKTSFISEIVFWKQIQLEMRPTFIAKEKVNKFEIPILCKEKAWHPTPVLLPGKSHGPRSLVGCSPWDR